MWNRILGKSTELDTKSSASENPRKSESHRRTPQRSASQKSTTSSRKTTRSEDHDRGFNPTSTSYSSTTQNRFPGTASASIASSYATAYNDPTNQDYLPPGLVRNASLADQIPKTRPGDSQRTVAVGSRDRADDPAIMEERPPHRERRGTRDKDDEKRESKSHRDKKRRSTGKGTERGMSTDDAAYTTSQRGDGVPTSLSSGVGGSSFVPLAEQDDSRADYTHDRPHVQSTHVQDQFPGQFPTQSAAPYRPPLSAREGGPGLAAEYYGDVGQSVVEQPGVRIHSPSLIVGAEPHLQAASTVAAPPLEPSASGGTGAAASFFDGTFSAGFDMEGHPSSKPAPTNGSSSLSYSSAAPSMSTYSTSGARPPAHQSSSVPILPTIGSAAAGAAAGYYMSSRPSKPGRPVQATSLTSGFGEMSGSSSHYNASQTNASYTSYPSSGRPLTKPGKHSSQSSNMPLYAAGAAGIAAAASHHNHNGSTPHGSTHQSSNGQYYGGSSMAQQHHHQHHGPFSKLVDFFKDPDGVAQFEEYTEYIGVCRHCFDPRSSPRDAPRRHQSSRRRSHERFGSNVRVDKDHRYSSSESESRRRKKNSSWLGAGIAGYGLGKMGESLFLNDNSSHESRSDHRGKVKSSHRRRRSSSSERKSRTSYGVVNRSSDTVSRSRKSRSKDRAETGITSDGKIYRKDSHGNIDTSKVKIDNSRHRSRSRSRDHHGNASSVALGAALGSTVVASHSRRRSKSPKKAFVRSKHGHKENSSELASILNLSESDPRGSRRRSHHSPESRHRSDRRKEKKSRGFFSFSNSSSSSATSAQSFGNGHDQKAGRRAETKRKGKKDRDTEAALLGLGAAALAFNQSQRPKRKSELIAVKESKGKHNEDKHGHKGKRSSEEDPWESASEGEYSSADSELAYGGSMHRRSQESLSSASSGLDKWNWRWGSKKQNKKPSKDRRHSPTSDSIGPVAASSAMMTGANYLPQGAQNHEDSRMTSTNSIPLQHVYPMPTSDPTRFDVAKHDAGAPSYQPFINARPDPVPIQHPQPVAPVSAAVYTSQAPYSHSYSAPTGLSSEIQYSHPSSAPIHDVGITGPRSNLPGAFPAGNEYFEPSTTNQKKDPRPRRRDSSPVTHTPEYTPSSASSRRRRSLKDDASSVRFDLTKEQEDKDRQDERRRNKEEGKRRERISERESDERKSSVRESRGKQDPYNIESASRSSREPKTDSAGIKKESWAAPAAAGVIAAAVGATMAAGASKHDKSAHERRKDDEERDIEVIVRERPTSDQNKTSSEERGRTPESDKKGMSVWQAAAKVKKSSSHTGYAAYFTPTELLSKEPGVKETVGANADNDITVHQVPNMITIQPSKISGDSPSRVYSFPITAEDMEHSVKRFPWAVPQLNLVEATPPTSRAGSVVGSRSPRIPSPLANEIPDIPLEPLESVMTPEPSISEPAHVEYTVIEPKGRSIELVDSPVSDKDIPDSVPGISSLKKKKQKSHNESPRDVDYGDDLDFAATVAAGLQKTGFDPSIVADDPSFGRRDSPPGSEDDVYRRRPVMTVTEITPDHPSPPSPPHGFVQEIDEPQMPGSFQEDEVQPSQSRQNKDATKRTKHMRERSRSPEELTGPSDNADRKPNVYSTEEDAFRQEDLTNAAIDPVGDRPHTGRRQARHDTTTEDTTEPSDNAGRKPHAYTAEPEPLEPEDPRNVAIDPVLANQRSMGSTDEISQIQPRSKASTSDNTNSNVLEYKSDDAPSVVANAPRPPSSRKDSKSSKKSKRRSVGFDDNTSVTSSPPTYGGTRDSSSASKSGRKGGLFGLFSKSTDNLPESKGLRQTPTEASLEDFEEPRERKKKSKSRRQDRDDDETPPVRTEESVVSSQPEAQDDWDTPKKSRRGKEKRRSSGDPGRITQDLPAQVIPPASSGHDLFPKSNEMLTSFEGHESGRSRKRSGSDETFEEMAEPSRIHDNEQPSFLGERPEKPPLPDTPDASEDPGGQVAPEPIVQSDQSQKSPADQSESSTIKPERLNRPISDFQSDGRRVSYSSASPTAIPLRPLRFGRRPSSPGLARSLPSTPQPSTAADPPLTPRRRERPHSTEFRSNEIRPMWLLEKYGPRQEPAPQETYPSLPSSHSTSRASSVHESDDLYQTDYQTEALDLALDEANYCRFMQEPRGLMIDTSHRENDPGLLDSQQTTPTAASFHSMAKDGDIDPPESVKDTTPESREMRPYSTDLISPASEYHDPLNEPAREQRLLHGVEDIFPQRRSPSPSRYDTGLEARLSNQSPSQAEEEMIPKTVVDGSRRPTVEESLLMQEQDAQDAVDSWFAPAQPKRPNLKLKGRKRGKSYEGTQSTEQLDESQSILQDTIATAEPREATLAGNLRDEPSEPVADLNYQAAMTTRRDSTKGKKRKNKKKLTDPLEETTDEVTGSIPLRQFDAEPTLGPSPIFTDPFTIEPSSTQLTAMKESPGLFAEEESLSKAEGLDIAPEAETSFATTKKTKKGKRKNRSLSLLEPEQEQTQGPDVPIIARPRESEPIEVATEEALLEAFQPEKPNVEGLVKDISSPDLTEVPTTRRFGSPEIVPQVSPEAIPLPVDDDLDLLEALPESPVLQPIDAQSTSHEQSSEARDPPSLGTINFRSDPFQSLAEASNIEPTTLSKAISELALPENVAAATVVEEGEADGFPLVTSKKSKRDKKKNKGKASQAPAFAPGAPIDEEPIPLASSSSFTEANDGLTTTPDPSSKEDQSSFTASASRDDPDSFSTQRAETPKEQPVDEWPDFTSKKSKKGKKGRKDKSIGEESMERDLGSSTTMMDLASVESSKGISKPDELPAPLANVSVDETEVSEAHEPGPNKPEPSELAEEPIFPVTEEPEWPSMSKKKKKGKKTKGVSFDDFADAQPKELSTTDPTERAEATTGTAREVQDLLHGQASGQSEEKSPAPALVPSEDGLLELTDPAQLPISSLPVADPEAIASTETAAQVQDMLTREDEFGSPQASRDIGADLEQATEADEFAWAPKKKTKKGKKSKSSEEVTPADNEKPDNQRFQEPFEREMVATAESTHDAPVDEFATKKSKKDTKSKRKGLSRSASDFEPQGTSQVVPSSVEEPLDADMAMTDNAPSALENTDQLPVVELPISPVAEGPSIAPATTEMTELATEADASTIIKDACIDPTSVEPEPLSTSEIISQSSHAEEEDVFADAPSFMEKHDNFASLDHPVSQDVETPMIDQNDATVSTSADRTLDTKEPLPHDLASPPAYPRDTTLALEELPESTETPAVPVPDDEYLGGLPREPSGGVAGDETFTIEGTTQADREPSLETSTKSKKEKKKGKKSKALAWEDDSPAAVVQPSTEASEAQEKALDAQIEKPIEDLTAGDEAIAPSILPVSKKDKKKKKKANQSAWYDDVPEASTEAIEPLSESVQLEREQPSEFVVVPDQEAELVEEPSAQPPEPSAETAFETPSSKKGKKKGKKSKFVAWDEEEPTIPTQDEPQQPTTATQEAAIGDDGQAVTVETPADERTETIEDQSAAKKGKKKGKKSKYVDFDDEPVVSQSKDEEIPLDSTPLETEPEAAVPSDTLQTVEPVEEAANTFDEQPKKSKKSKKSKFVDFTEESSVPSPVEESISRDPILTEPELVAEEPKEILEETNLREESIDSFEPSTSKKSKKKGKKSKFVDWDEEPSLPKVPLVEDEADQRAPISTESEVATEQTGDVLEPAGKEEATVVPEDSPAIPKKKKKGKKSSFVAWDDEPSVPPVEDETALGSRDKAQAVEQTSSDLPVKDGAVLELNEDLAMTTPKSKKDKKKAKKAKALSWEDEEASPAIEEEPLVLGTDAELPEESNDVESKTEEGVTADVHESLLADEIERGSERSAAMEKEEPETASPLSIEPKAEDVTFESQDAPLDLIEETHVGEPSLPAAVPETVQEPSDEARDRYLSTPRADDIAAQHDSMEKSVDDPVELEPSYETEPQGHTQDHSSTPDQVVQDTSPLLLQVHAGPQIATSIEDAPKDSGATTAADNTSQDRSALSINAMNESSDPLVLQPALDNTELADKQEGALSRELIDRGPDFSADVPIESGERSQELESGTDAVAEDFAPVSKKDKKKAKKSKKTLAWEDEAEAFIDDEDAVTVEKTEETNTTSDQPTSEPTTTSDQTFEDTLAVSKKDKKKSKKKSKAFSFDDEPSESATPVELDPKPEAADQPAEPLLPTDLTLAEETADFRPSSKKDKKKSKKAKPTFDFDDEPSSSLPQAEADTEGGAMDQIAEESSLPNEPSVPEDIGFTALSKKDRKKSKKTRSTFDFEDEPSPIISPAEADPEGEIMDQSMEEPSASAEPSILEDIVSAPLSKKDRKKSKKAKGTFVFDEEPSLDMIPADPSLDETSASRIEDTALPIEANRAILDDEFPDVSKKDKKKAKKNRKAFNFDEELAEDTMPAEPTLNETPAVQIDENAMPVEANRAILDYDFPDVSKNDKKKSKKNRKAFNFDDEPTEETAPAELTEDATSAEPRPEPTSAKTPAEPTIETSSVPELSFPTPEDDTLFPGKKVEKSKKNRKAFSFDEEPSEDTTPAEPEPTLDETTAGSIAESIVPAEPGVATPEEEFADFGKKNKKSKKNKKPFDLDEEPLESRTIAEAMFEEALAEGTKEPALSDVPPVTAPEEEFPEFGKKSKKSKKAKKAFTFDDEPPEILASAETENLVREMVPDQPIASTEPIPGEGPEEFPDFGKKNKKSKKDKKALVFDDEPLETEAPTASEGLQQDEFIDQPPLAAEENVVEAPEDFPTMPGKKEKKSKKNKKAVAFDEEEPPLDTAPAEVLNPTTEERALPTEPSAYEAIDEFEPSSKKDRKKGKKASSFDEPLESQTPAESNLPNEMTGFDVPEEFITESKKDKKKAKKAKKSFNWQDETPEADPSVSEATPLSESLQVDRSLPSVEQPEQSEETGISKPRDIPPILPTRPDDTHIVLQAEPKEEALFRDVTPRIDESIRTDEAEPEFASNVDESNLFVSSKKAKKDKKKAKKSQALSWDDDEDVSKALLPEIATLTEDMPTTLPEIVEGQKLESDNEPANLAASPSIPEYLEQVSTPEPTAASPFEGQERVPRHQDPTLVTPVNITASTQRLPSPSPEKSWDHQDYLSVEQAVEEPNFQPVAPGVELVEEPAESKAREMDPPNDDEFASFASTKKSKKSKKGKRQFIDWEDDTVTPPAHVQESSKAVADNDVAARPEMAAWPTEVRLNQTPTPFNPEDQPASPVRELNETSLAQDQYLPDEPQEPAPIEDNRTDYFAPEPSRDFPSQPQPFEDNALYAPPSPAPLLPTEDTQSKIKTSVMHEAIPVDTPRESADPQATATKQPESQDMAAGPVDDFEGFTSTKKDKKSKRKKKQALDDVMWEFPSIPPTADVTPVESKWPSDPSRGDRLFREQPAIVPTDEQQDLASSERNIQEVPAGATSGEQIFEPFVDMRRQMGVEGESDIVEEPQTGDAPEQDWGAVSKKAKKGKKSKKGKATDDFAEPEPEEQPAAPSFEEVEDSSRTGKTSTSPGVDTIEAIAAAAAISAGLATAEGLSRKESKKDKKKKKGRHASSNWTEPEEEATPRDEAMIEGDESKAQSRTPTPERRSPISAWHQNISPSQSPMQSELYDVEDERPRSATSSRRKRSYNEERRQSVTRERQSPIEAWHQYDSPGQSPRQSELYDYDRREVRDNHEHASGGAVNRDSAVHVADSPRVSSQSPVRHAMRDSGYPDTETSPIVGQEVEHGDHLHGTTREVESGNAEPRRADPPRNLSEDVSENRKPKKRTRSRSPARHEDNRDHEEPDLPPRHARPGSFDNVREPSPVSSTTKDRSSALFQSSPSTREEQAQREEQRQAQAQGSPTPREYLHHHAERSPHPAARSPGEDNSALVNARAESLAALSGQRGPSQEQSRSLFGGPVGISSDGISPETPMDQDRRRLNTITEYSPEESPLHKKNRDVGDVGVSAHGVKAARRSGTPQAISKRRARSPLAESTTDDMAPRPFWPSMDEDKQALDVERSRSRNTEQRPSSHQSNISSLVSGPPKQREYERRSFSGASNHSIESINAIIRTPPDQMRSASGMSNRSSGTPPLRRANRSVSGDLRGANRKSEANKRAKQPEAEPLEVDTSIALPPLSTTPHDPTKDKSKGLVKGMADVFVSSSSLRMTTCACLTDRSELQEGYGDFHGSPLSPTRPPSVRRRQSMQVLELESRNDRLIAENRQLHEAKLRADRDVEDAAHHQNEEIASYREGIQTRETWLRQKDTELSQLKETIENLQSHVAQLDEANQELHTSSRGGLDDHQENYTQLEAEHAQVHQQWQQSVRDLEDLRHQHAQLSAGMEDIVRHEVTTALESKNHECSTLQSSLSSAQAQIHTLQAQLLASTSKQHSSSASSDSLLSRDEDYFDQLCSSLHTHIQQWVLRFSKFSDSRSCYLTPELSTSSSEKTLDRIENSILDGTDPDIYLRDRIKRRDIFMSLTMTMIWEYIFTRYLFGADREQRQKLKSLEKLLADTPRNSKGAIHKWRATTLHLLSKRDAFVKQRDTDTEAVMHTIYETLSTILPPPSHLVPQIQTSLLKVLAKAVELSIEMRTQRW
ncbi:MAG: hypothetical protein Q9168_004613, partial [Polycauliona sp. 1 TL-2023]